MNSAVVALGSNISPKQNMKAALEALAKSFSLIRKSRFVYTKPVGYKEQPDFLNGAVLIRTSGDQAQTEAILKKIEDELGRQRTGRKDGPRKIDLDLTVFNGQVVDDDVFKRDFLRQSIREVLPTLELLK